MTIDELKESLSRMELTSTDIKDRHQRMVLEALADGSMHIEQMMAVCGYRNRDSFRKSVLNDMLAKGLVQMTHPENVRHKEQRYLITNLGRDYLQ